MFRAALILARLYDVIIDHSILFLSELYFWEGEGEPNTIGGFYFLQHV